MLASMKRAAFSSSSPPISPTMTTSSVSSSASKRWRMSMNEEPTTGSPPIPTIVEFPRPSCASSCPIWYVSVPERETRPNEPSRKIAAGMSPTVALPGRRAQACGDATRQQRAYALCLRVRTARPLEPRLECHRVVGPARLLDPQPGGLEELAPLVLGVVPHVRRVAEPIGLLVRLRDEEV